MDGLVLTGIGELTTSDESAVVTGPAAVVCTAAGTVAWVGPERDLPEAVGSDRIDLGGRAVIPGFVDSHTHLVFAGSRAEEWAARMAGVPYEAGGIRTTVAATRTAPDDALVAGAAGLAAEAERSGTTTIEVKSGYGLDVETEPRLLEAAGTVTGETTFLGAHVVPSEYAGRPDEYVALVAGPMLQACAPRARWIDVFCDRGAFDGDQSRAVLEAGRAAGLGLRVHGNQLEEGPGVGLAVELDAASVDHCTHLAPADVEALAGAARTVATLLPAAEFSTRSPYPDARRLLDAGVRVALASDCNPGTSYTTSMPFVISLATRYMGMTVPEAVVAATAGGAAALRRDDVGRLAPGCRADLVVLEAPTALWLGYRPGVNLVAAVVRAGQLVAGRRAVGGDVVSESGSVLPPAPFGSATETDEERLERARARLDAQSLVLRVQTDLAGTTEATEALVARAEERQWWDVALLALYAQVVGMTSGGQPEALDACRERMVALAELTRDPAGLALTMAAQAGFLGEGDGPQRAMTAQADLARAVVLLENGSGGAFERIDAHIECASVFGADRLWELEIDQYVAALAVDLSSEHPDALSEPSSSGGRWAIKANLAEVQCHWVCALYLTGDRQATQAAAAESLTIFADAAEAGLPAEWLPDLEAMRLLTTVVAGEDVAEAAKECLEHLEPASPFAGVAHLAIAVSERLSGAGTGLTSIEAAVACLAGSDLVMEYEVAISLSVDAEAERLGRETAGLRFVRHHNSHHWSDRIARLNAMVGLINAERFRVERETFERVAHVDDLTKLANRRGYHRYLAGFGTAGNRDVAVLAMDVDRFKAINDRFGHLAGDDALRRIGAVLASQVRPEDLAARVGGDEFVIVLAGANLEAAMQRAEQVIAMLGRRGRWSGAGFSGPIDVSIGVAAGPPERVEDLRQAADEALYEAKSRGGGRAVGADRLPAAD